MILRRKEILAKYDAGTKQIEWMKKTTGPKLVGAVAQDSFQIGYQAVSVNILNCEEEKWVSLTKF